LLDTRLAYLRVKINKYH
jgi:hypothetical protein